MQFQHPELLYALFLLLIPILIHLFQLRRFQKVAFTNVAFLKKVNLQTRKSSQLKKWLTLLMRLLALACIIVAFAQPFSASKTALNTNKETVVYVDNSFSMQAKGPNGPLLQRALQQLFDQVNEKGKISWLTNDMEKKDVAITDFKNEILGVPFSSKQLTLEEVFLKADQLFSKDLNSEKRLLIISDFQGPPKFPELPDDYLIDVVPLKPVSTTNVAIDTAYIGAKSSGDVNLKVQVSGMGDVPQTVSVSLFNEKVLVAKTAIDLSEEKQNTLSFDLDNPSDFRGRLTLTDPNLLYDNELFFSINTPKKIKVLAVNEAESDFLQRMFGTDEFDFIQQTSRNLNYNDFPEQNFIILNEIATIPASLTAALTAFLDRGGSLLIIPPTTADISSYNSLLNRLRLGTLSDEIKVEKKITKIQFDHPLYQNVFEKRVVNFQYPKVNSFYPLSSNASIALRLEDDAPFIVQRANVYLSTAAWNTNNTNFKSSPLIVPTLYNMAQQSLALPKLYYTIGDDNQFSVAEQLTQDEILTFRNGEDSFIPLQQTKANQVDITTSEEPAKAANYSIEKEMQTLGSVSYNYNRLESSLSYADVETWEGVTTHASITELFDRIKENNAIHSFWKWFVIFALMFLFAEMLILKFYK